MTAPGIDSCSLAPLYFEAFFGASTGRCNGFLRLCPKVLSCLMTSLPIAGIERYPIRGGHPGSGGRGWIEVVSVVADRRLV
ncbi:hypothetical protein EP837_04076 (plasmid) [Sphingobium sp. EP60837]|nr:hypothetical protein EP837_04076 [Sphingobium sp. EP60837]